MTEDARDRESSAVTSALLSSGATLHVFASAVFVATIVILIQGAGALRVPLGLVVVACAALETWYAMRVRIDHVLFDRLSKCERIDLALLDAGLAGAGLRTQAGDGDIRPLADRIAGARGLIFRQGLTAGGAAIVFVLAWGLA